MPSVPQKTPQNIWPLGKLTINHGVPVSVLVNVGSQDAGTSVSRYAPSGKLYSSLCDQLIFSTQSTNTGDVYVQYGNFAGPDTNVTMLAIARGVVVSIPYGTECHSGQIDLTQIYVDGTTSDVVYVTAIGGN